jgi:predicted ribosome quality control (RQC) complex YloA/Tae2 family protein
MKRQLSSLDIHFLVKELQSLKDSRVDKVYNPEKNVVVISLYKSNGGKNLLKIDNGKYLSVSNEKDTYGETLGFGMFLRKHIGGYFLYEITQINPERILKMSFKVKDTKKFLYIELFGKGNLVLCDENSIILNALEHHVFRDRTLKPKVEYKHPIMKHNFLIIDEKELAGLLKESRKDSLITCLATDLGLGGLYSEEICLMSKIDKNKKTKEIDEKEVSSIVRSIAKLVNKKIDPKIVFKDKKLIDFIPFNMEFYHDNVFNDVKNFSQAVSQFFVQFVEVKESEFEKKITTLKRIIGEQENTLMEFENSEIELREKGELIYHQYKTAKEVLGEINKASKKYSWREIKNKLKGHKVVKDINIADRKVVLEL